MPARFSLGGRIFPGSGGFSPLALSPYAWWDATRPTSITQSGGLVSAWSDIVTGYTVSQASSGQQPTISGNWLTYDGIDDTLAGGTVPASWPTTTAFEVWSLVRQTALVADTTSRNIFGWGGSSSTTATQMLRIVSGSNRFRGQATNGTVAGTIQDGVGDFSGRHVLRMVVDGTNVSGEFDGVALVPAALAGIQTNSARFRIGANAAAAPAAFWQGDVSVLVTCPPTNAANRARMYSYLNGVT